jgi:hypothetical protein
VTIRLPLGLEDLNWMVGMNFPEADEDALWRLADSWRRAAAQLRQLNPEAVRIGGEVVTGMDDDAGRAFAELWQSIAGEPSGYQSMIAEACDQLAEACDGAAVEVEYAKLQYVVALVILAATIAWLLATAALGGVSAAGIPVAVAAAHLTIRLVLARLLTAVVVGAGINVIIDALVQFTQVVKGHRDEWDLAKTGQAAQSGAVYGAAGGAGFLLAGRVAPGLLQSSAGILGTAAAANTVAGLGISLADGELPTVNGVFTALVSGTLGALGPDIVGSHPRVSTPELRLDLDGGEAGTLAGISDHLRDATGSAGLDGGWGRPARADLFDRLEMGAGRGGSADASAGDRNGGAPIDDTALAGSTASPAAPGGHATTTTTGQDPVGGPVRLSAADAGFPAAHQIVTQPTATWHATGPAAIPFVEPVSPRPAPGSTPGQLTPVPGSVPPTTASSGTASSGTASPGTASSGASPGIANPGTAAGPAPTTPGATAPSAIAPTTPGAAASGSAAAGPVVGDRTAAGAVPEPALAVVAGADHMSATQASGPGHGGGRDQLPEPNPASPSTPVQHLTDAQAVELVRQTAFATDAGFGFYAALDEVREFAEAVHPTEGYVTLDLHGSPRGFTIADHILSPEQFAHALRDLIDDGVLTLPDGAGIKLLSCDTATGGSDSPAARLARALGIEVLAPDQPVWTALDGQEIVASPVPFGGVFVPAYPPDGQWHRFDPAGVDVALDFDPGYHGDNAQSLLDSRSIADERGYLARAPGGQLDTASVLRLEPDALVGCDPAEIIAAIPETWPHRPSRSGGGEVFEHPTNRGEQLRIMPGYPPESRLDPVTHGPYAVITKDGERIKVPLMGNAMLGGEE